MTVRKEDCNLGIKFILKCTFGGIILQIPCFSAKGLMLLIYSSGPLSNSSCVGRNTGHILGGLKSNILSELNLWVKNEEDNGTGAASVGVGVVVDDDKVAIF